MRGRMAKEVRTQGKVKVTAPKLNMDGLPSDYEETLGQCVVAYQCGGH